MGRLDYAKAISSQWWTGVVGVWSAICTGDTLVQHYGTPASIADWNRAWVAPRVWEIWIIGLLFISVFAIFEKFYRLVRDLKNRLSDVKTRLDDRRPRLAFRVAPVGGNDLRGLENCIPPPVFNLLHLAGDGARFVNVGPIKSPSGRKVLFETVNAVTPPVQVSLPFSVRFKDGTKGPRNDNWDQRMEALIDFSLPITRPVRENRHMVCLSHLNGKGRPTRTAVAVSGIAAPNGVSLCWRD